MLQTASQTNPPVIVARSRARTTKTKPTESALSVISADVMPIGDDPNLLDQCRSLSEQKDVGSLIALYDAYIAAAQGYHLIMNMPRADSVDDFLEKERCRTIAKAYLVADFLKQLQPDKYNAEPYAGVLFDCTLQMGGTFVEAAAVAQEIISRGVRAS